MKKLISLLVVLAMLMAMVPAVFATETTAYQEVTIPEAIELAQEGSETKYLVRGTVTEVVNTTYGNLYIEDAEGNSLYVYGMYSVDGVDRYDAMETKPVAGDEVLLLGLLTTYNGTAQMKNAWLQELNGDVLEAPEVAPDPEADTELTIAEAIALGVSKAHNTYTAGKYYVTGEVTEIYNTTYGNMYIQDAEGNTLTIYGTYDADGTNRFDAMENQPAVGDTITVYGIIGQYNGTAQMKNGWIQEAAEEETPAGNALVLGNNELAAAQSTPSEYTFTATQTGTLYITIRNYTCNDIEYGAEMLEYKWSQIFVNDVALIAMETELEVTAGDVLTIVMTSDSDDYTSNLYLSFEGFYEEPVGGQYNPIELTPDECPVYTPEIAPGEEVYYTLDDEFYDSVLCVYGENAYLIYQGWREDNTWGDVRVDAVDGVLIWSVWNYEICIGNAGDTAATFEIDSYIPLGTEGNPDELVIGENVAQMTSGDWVPYFYSWTAEASGTLTVTVTGDSNWILNVENPNSGDSYYYFESAGDPNTVSIAVAAGDEVMVMVRLIDAETWEGIEGTLTITATFEEGAGEDLSLHLENNYVKVRNAIGDPVTKDYTYVAEQTGTLYITFRSFGCFGYYWEESALSDEYNLTCVNVFINGEQTTVFQNAVEVTEGDSVVVTIASLDGYPYEANIWLSYEGFYEEPVGSDLNPIEVSVEDLPTDTVEIPAGEELYHKFSYEFYDYVLYIYGEDAYIVVGRYNYETDRTEDVYIYAENGVVEYNFEDGLDIRIGNAGETAATFEMDAVIPLGIYNNPDTLIIGEQIANVPGNYEGYWYIYTAEEAGTLTVTVIGEGWGFELSNNANYTYIYRYAMNDDSNTASVEVAAGDQVRLNVLIIEGEWEGYPGGELTVVAEFTPAGGEGGGEEEEYELGDVNHDGWIDVEDAMMILQYDAVLIEDADLDLNLADVSGDGYVDVEDAMLVLQFDAMLIEKFPAEEEGGEEGGEDAAELPLGYYQEIEAGTYAFTAEEDTLLVLAMNVMENPEWAYTINGVTRAYYDDVAVSATVLKVAAGETVTVVFDSLTYAHVASCAGTAEDPVMAAFAWNEEYTAAYLNIDMPAGDYVFTMNSGAGMILTVDGVVTEMTGDGWYDPIVFSATVAEAGIVPMSLTYSVGSYYNPENLELGYNAADVVDTDQGYWYTYTAEEDTLFVLSMFGENWFYSAMILRADGTFGYPDGHWTSEDPMVPMQVLELKAGDKVLLNFGTDDYSADTVEFTATTCTGTAESPIEVQFVMNEAYTEGTLNIDMPAGDYVFQMMTGAGMILTVDGVVTEMTGDGWFDPIRFSASVAEAGIVEMTLTYPVGSYYNPESLELGYNAAEVDESGMGYWYTYTAESDCLFALSMFGENWFYSAMIMRADGTYGYPDGHYSSEEAVVPMQVLELKAGDILLLNFGTDDYAAATVEFTATTCTGTAESPIEVQFVMNEAYTEGTLNIDMPAGDYVFQMMTGAGMILTVDGVVTEMTGDGWFDPIRFSASVTEAGIVEMTLTYPAGSYYNPENLELGYNAAEVDESGMGYWYTYTAESDCLFYLNVYGENWFYSAMIMRADGTYGYPDGHYSSEEAVVPMQVLELKAGDILLLNFGTDDYAAATVEFEAYTCAGTEEDPILVQFVYNETGTAASLNIDLPAGEFVLATRGISYMDLAIEGAEFEFVAAMTMRDMDKIYLTVAEAGVVSLEATYPVGTWTNPEIVDGGEYTAEIEEGNVDGHFYNFVATVDGTLTITVNAEPGWFFVVNNLTAGTYGDAKFSGESENTMTIEVSAGDEIEIIVNVYDPDNGMGVGGTINMALTFTPAE